MPYKDKDKEKAYQKEYREKNKEKNKAYQKIYRKENEDKLKNKQKISYLKNRESYINKQRKYFKKNEKILKSNRRKKKIIYQREYMKNPDNQIKIKAREIAKQIIIEGLCELCNERPATQKHHQNYDKPLEVMFVCPPCHGQIHGYGLMGVN